MRLKIRKSPLVCCTLEGQKGGREGRNRKRKKLGPEGLSGARLVFSLAEQGPKS
jgi:hypothetical protein